MTIQQLVNRFPEIPQDLHDEAVLARFAEVFHALLCKARNPSPCATQHEPANHYYLRLIGPLSIYGYGLSGRDEVLSELQDLLDRHDADPDGFAASLVPPDAAERETPGPGCS